MKRRRSPSQLREGGRFYLGEGRTERSRRPRGERIFGYTLGVGLILKLVAGLMAGLREYFFIVVAVVGVPCVVLLLILAVRISWPSRARRADSKDS